ncbi:aspartate--tRNA ligase [Candidatus Parcubacteria bacterium]|nr:aspartate--tRNA ligase [Candidatus Parcubacteria bacterium]
MLRTHTCGELKKKNVDETVTLCGWVHRWRDHGGVIFIDLRDRYGLTQIKFDPELNKKTHTLAEKLRSEWVIKAVGKVVGRPGDMVNSKLRTGEIEIQVDELEVLNQSKTPPFELEEEKKIEVKENIRLKYRYIDLRRPELQDLLDLKDKFIQHCRAYMSKLGFVEVQTPILASSSPEGARDFLVPSRLHQGQFYALPQAPQIFKQLLMVGGMDKYFQIAPCFRDEDSRMDRAYGEFYQLDMEMSFAEQDDILLTMEPLLKELTKKFSDKKLINLNKDERFLQIPYLEAMNKYGTDKPDIRFELEIQPVTDLVKGCGFKVFADMATKPGYVVHALKIKDGAKFTRKEIDEFTGIANDNEAKGLAYIVVHKDKLQSPIVKFLGDKLAAKIVSETKAKPGDIIFFGADKWRIVCAALGAVRSASAEKLGLKDPKQAAWCWVVDFPMFSMSEIEDGRIDFDHNPFSMPCGGLKALEGEDPLTIKAQQFDLVLNGFECSSGAIRNHDPKVMYKAFTIAGYTRDEVDQKFGALISAFEYGAPPHGGNALGLDRILMTLLELNSIRDIYAFPKDGQGRDLMMDSPHSASDKQLKEVGIKLRKV